MSSPSPRRLVRLLALLAAVVLAAASPVRAQQSDAARTIDPGMTHAQVVARLGRPKGERAAGEYTYLFYANGCLRKCGMDDVVTLQNDAVVDAIFRGGGRRYTGVSSSPRALSPAAARGGARTGSGASSGAARPGDDEREPTVGAITTTDSVPAGSRPGGLVIAGRDSGDSGAPATPAARRPRGGRGSARNARRRRAAAVRPTVPPIRLSGEDSAAMADGVSPRGTAAPAPVQIDPARTGRRTTTGPVDAGAAVKNAGGRLYPSATPVRPSSGPAADSAAGASAGRVPFQGSKLAPADSAAAVNRRPPPAVPPKSDSTRPTPPAARR